jgi:MoaA/NifB/PqqE/SkfB family radical SAM enzyme
MTGAKHIPRQTTCQRNGKNISDVFQNYTPRPEHPDWSALYADARLLADKIRPQLETPVPLWQYLRRQSHGWTTLLRNHIDNLRLARHGGYDLWPLYFIWTCYRACNFRCIYCDDHRGNKYPDLPNTGVLGTTQAIRLLKIMRTRTPSVLISGGEPTLREDLPIITRAARDLKYFPIVINTNGSILHQLLKKQQWRSWLADVDHIVVSLDALDISVLSQMWSYPRPQEVMRNILLLRELAYGMRFKLMISTVVQPGFIHHAHEVLDLCNDLDLCFCPMPVNAGPTIDQSLFEDPEYRGFIELILARKRCGYRVAGSERMNVRMLTSQPLQCRNTLKPHVDFDGRLFWPCKASVTIQPEMIRTLDFEDVDSMYEHANQLIDPTDFQGRCGAHCNWSQHYTTDAYVYGLTNARSLIKEISNFLRAT